MWIPPVVEAGLDLDPEAQLTTNSDDAPDDPVPGDASRRLVDGHEVLHLAHARLGEEPRDEDVRVREVELLLGPTIGRRRDAVVAATFSVEDRAEDARRVEVGAAIPVDRPVRPHERHRVQIADDSVLGDREVPGERSGRRGGGLLLDACHVAHWDAVMSLRASAFSIRYITCG